MSSTCIQCEEDFRTGTILLEEFRKKEREEAFTNSIKSDSIQIGRTHLQNIGDTFARVGSLVDFVAEQLQCIHCEQQGIPYTRSAATLYQLREILRNLDHDIISRETTIKELTGELHD